MYHNFKDVRLFGSQNFVDPAALEARLHCMFQLRQMDVSQPSNWGNLGSAVPWHIARRLANGLAASQPNG